MSNEKGLHKRNPHNDKYDFKALVKSHAGLGKYVSENKYGDPSIDFSNANAVIALNTALVAKFYEVENWSVPKGHLCPPIPGRADYIHYIADLLANSNEGEIPKGTKVKGLDIGTGTACIYPLIGNKTYGWKFIATDIDANSISTSKIIINSDSGLKKNVKCRIQKNSEHIFKDIIQSDEKFDFTMCNPPFHSSLEEASQGSARKVKNLNYNKAKKGHKEVATNTPANFGGQKAELWCPGGEVRFINNMINESVKFKSHCTWFTSLVSNKSNLNDFHTLLKKVKVTNSTTIEMQHGNKISHILAWTFN